MQRNCSFQIVDVISIISYKLLFPGPSTSVAMKRLPSNPVCKAVDSIQRLMKEKGYSLSGGNVFKKVEDSSFTSVYASDVRTFLLRSLANDEIANSLVCHINQVTSLLSSPACRLIRPLEIDYNLIEVLPKGVCFHIAGKRFVKYYG